MICKQNFSCGLDMLMFYECYDLKISDMCFKLLLLLIVSMRACGVDVYGSETDYM